MDAQLKAKWIEALRSGKYKQARGTLREYNHPLYDPVPRFCCLGVLADIQGAEWENAHPLIKKSSAMHAEGGWLKEHHAGGLLLMDQKTLSDMNDGKGRASASFSEIADFIEYNL